MEWLLQLADEIDDVIGVLRHGWVGVRAHVSVGISAAAAAAVATAMGAGARLRGYRA